MAILHGWSPQAYLAALFVRTCHRRFDPLSVNSSFQTQGERRTRQNIPGLRDAGGFHASKRRQTMLERSAVSILYIEA